MPSWWRAYLIALCVVALGLVPSFLGKGKLDDVRRQQQDLAANGKPFTATITHMEQGGGKFAYQTVMYEYTIAGQKHYGSTDPGVSDYMGMSVGHAIPIVYSPSDPDVSGYHPERWLKGDSSYKTAGLVIVAVGVILLFFIAALDVSRRSTGIDPFDSGAVTSWGNSMANSYRPPAVILGVGILFFIAGAIFQVITLAQIATGTPIPVTYSTGSHVVDQHFATPLEQIGMALFPIAFWGIGLAAILTWKNLRVITTPEHLIVINMFGNRFERAWTDIRFAQYKTKNGRPYGYVFGDGSKKISISTSLGDFDELDADVRSHLPGLLS